MSMDSIVRHNVGTCPGCREFLWAEAVVKVTPGLPTLNEQGRAHAYATAAITSVSLSHSCNGSEDS